ncbi:thiamine transport system ATP-binding protein [Marinospirillum celere]|uniref:Thiamine transport system ATP-binding protein n=1 Tax=Marinospirillum celere TaxID=1122252 RepID=A0A1I1DS32_9GAMM|nr:ATP-binding cassette domain-containing protein [Marinospirillum celere]SFB77795.1 thiamine transport system ATP-binding protein [Marinospirillum celere]
MSLASRGEKTPLLAIQRLQIRQGTHFWEHNLQLHAGEVAVIKGPSGCGKTTLLEALAGFVPIESGCLVIAGDSVENWPAEKRPVSLLFQQQNFFEHLDITTNLKLGFPNASPSTHQWQQVLNACQLLGVAAFLERKPSELSGGQKQRLALIRTVLRPQPLVLLDEPFSALDDHHRQLAGDWLREEIKASQRAALLVSHRPEDAERLADQLLLLE